MDTPEQNWFSQQPHRCRLAWGQRGARDAAASGDLLVVVDVLSFSTAVATATHHQVTVLPCFPDEKERLAQQLGAEPSVRRADVPRRGRFSLSPGTYFDAEPGTKVAIDSANGAACCVRGRHGSGVAAGALVNARPVAGWVARRLEKPGAAVTVLACGERWLSPFPGEEVRFALEDYLGAGAILSFLDFPKSPEAEVCEAAFRAVRGRLEEVVMHCGSGIELRDQGYAEDVRHAARLNLYEAVPVLVDGAFRDDRRPAGGKS